MVLIHCVCFCTADDSGVFKRVLGFTDEATLSLHHRFGANQLRNFIAHSKPKKQA